MVGEMRSSTERPTSVARSITSRRVFQSARFSTTATSTSDSSSASPRAKEPKSRTSMTDSPNRRRSSSANRARALLATDARETSTSAMPGMLPRAFHPLLEGGPASPVAEDDMVGQPQPHDLRRLGHAPGEQEVLGARGWIAAGMGMEEIHRGGSPLQALAKDLPRLYRDAADRAAEDLPLAEEVVADVEKERSHHLLITGAVAQGQVARYVHGAGEGLMVEELLAGHAPADLDGGEQRRGLGGSDAATPQRVGCRGEQTGEPAALPQQVHGHLESRDTLPAGAEQYCQQLGVGQRTPAM